MKKVIFLIAVVAAAASCRPKQESMEDLISDRLQRAIEQYEQLAAALADQPDKIPQSADPEGNLKTTSSDGWISGFVPGTLWYLYEYSAKPILKEYAVNYTKRVEKEKYNRDTHDLGFILYCSYGNGYRLTGDTAWRNVLLTGAESLSSRFSPVTGCTQSWDANEKWQFPVIIDNMMNLEFLFWASRESGDPSYRNICLSHADVTLRNHFRPDGSSYHVVSYDTITGQVEKKKTSQGFSDDSAWGRGQGWGLYGFTMMYRETGESKYLEQAKRIAGFILNHPKLPADGIPCWDFEAPGAPDAQRDASAGAIIASALIELSGYVDETLAKTYLEMAEKQIRTLSSPEYFAEKGTNGHFLLKHSVGSIPHQMDVDVPLTYADYYYVEALMRYRALKDKK
ncbi:MAG: glycoside hydrolase family 88 protein [Tannerella sp.]|jgi:rhamnogalacturonyl hydrolase YesR|nr:glycoside hydrolase family 88 protein [Tannerella sp.]